MIAGGGVVAIAGIGAAVVEMRRTGSMRDYAVAMSRIRAVLAARPTIPELIRYATLAPSGHNTQPWLFQASADRIAIIPDFRRRTPVVDPDDHHLFVSLGCAGETLAIAAGASGQPGELGFESTGSGGAVFSFGAGSAAEPTLFDAIPRRQSTRNEYDGSQVSARDLHAMAAAAAIPGVDLMLVTDRPAMNRLRDLVVAGNSAQMADPAFIRELKRWLRFSPREAVIKGDGLFTGASGNLVAPEGLGSQLFDRFVSAKGENDKYARQLASSAGVAVFVGERADPDHWVRTGRACQRFALQATALGLKCAFINQPVETPNLRPELASLIGAPGRRPDIVMRFGRSAGLPFSARRPVQGVIA